MSTLTFIYCAIISNFLPEPITGTPDPAGKSDHEIRTSIVWHWEDSFSPGEKKNVENWLLNVTGAVETTLGVYPFDLHFYLHRQNGSSEPVPWAHTRRDNNQGVKFYIDPSFAPGSFTEDWTAPHEISHLSIPYLGRQHAWFAEGYASYFIRLDKNLREEHGTSLTELIKEYQVCCRLEDRSVEEVVASWDNILGEPIFSELLHTYQTTPASGIL